MTKIYNNPGQIHQAERIEVTIRYQFNEKEYLWQLLKSGRVLMEGKALDESGDRLLFLGEAVLQMIAADCCYERPKAWIEFLEPKTLGQLAEQLEVTNWIQIRVDHPGHWSDERLIHLGEFLKLLTGLIYLDCNFYQVRDWFVGQVIGIDNPLIPPNYPGSGLPYRDFSHLGKSALNLIASDYLFARFPGVPKEVLCHIREGCKEKMLDLGEFEEKTLGKHYVKGRFIFVRNKLISLIQKAEK